MKPSLVAFAFATRDAPGKTRQAMAQLAAHLAEVSGIDVGVTPVPSYDALTQRLHHRDIDLAWVPPVPLIALTQSQRVTPVATLHRDQLVHFRCAFIAATASRIAAVGELRGKQAAWVDPHSAAGYVLPRMELASYGITTQELASERFMGSHDAVMRAVASNRADFGATFARISREGDVTGPWTGSGLEGSVRVLETFGEIPPDALVLRSDLDPATGRALTQAFYEMMDSPRGRTLVKTALGADALRPFESTMYDRFRVAVLEAHRQGILDATSIPDVPLSSPDATTQHRPDTLDEDDLLEVDDKPRGS